MLYANSSYVSARYWNWALYLDSPYNLETSPLFDGSLTSMSNNGIYDPNVSAIVVGGGAVCEYISRNVLSKTSGRRDFH